MKPNLETKLRKLLADKRKAAAERHSGYTNGWIDCLIFVIEELEHDNQSA